MPEKIYNRHRRHGRGQRPRGKIVKGAVEALENKEIKLMLLGRENEIKEELKKYTLTKAE